MDEKRPKRRLAAILAADEARTHAALKRHREVDFDPMVARHHSRIVKLIGDGTLVEFASVVEAVECALSIQRQAAQAEVRNGDPKIILRIGVNLGDIIIDEDDIYGDGVNIAARLEPLAEPGGVCVSSIVSESVGGRLKIAFRDFGEINVKNIDQPIRVWKWHPDSDGTGPQPADPNVDRGKADEPSQSIAVLPFNNMSQDAAQEYFSDGMTEDIITDLSKVGGLMVIARNSSFAYKGQSPDIRAVGRELGVRWVLEGSIRRAGSRVRITAQLIDSGTGGHVWADRYDRDLTDVFEIQDEVTRCIVAALQVALTPGEEALISDNPTANMAAYDLFLKARELLAGTITRETTDQARTLLERAIDLDPDYAEPYAGPV